MSMRLTVVDAGQVHDDPTSRLIDRIDDEADQFNLAGLELAGLLD